MTYRELWVFIKHLPPESWTQTRLRDADIEAASELVAPPPSEQQHGPWALDNYLQAQLIDAVRENTYITGVAGGIEPPMKPPVPVSRPGLRDARAVPSKLAEAQVLYLNQFRARG